MSTLNAPSIKTDTDKLAVYRSALTGAAVLGVIFSLCWIAAALHIGGTHMYITLFANAAPASFMALVVGLLWSLSFGFITGGLIANFYNAFAFVVRR